MKSVEMIVFAILGLMLLPDFCRRIGRPALLYPFYVLMGVGLGGVLEGGALDLLNGVGLFGFILLLFLIGLRRGNGDERQWGRISLLIISTTERERQRCFRR